MQYIKRPPCTDKAARNDTRDEIAYARILDVILEQHLVPGTESDEEVLDGVFGISRTIIRRTLSRLAHEQMMLLRPDHGVVVASPSIDEARQVPFARHTVECTVTEPVTDSTTVERLAELREMVVQE